MERMLLDEHGREIKQVSGDLPFEVKNKSETLEEIWRRLAYIDHHLHDGTAKDLVGEFMLELEHHLEDSRPNGRWLF
ncbi:MAG: hypothetical protein CMK30_03660 [Porticoccaceae bacterium]|nr:hypothetical protein [Porticoccaceae bacterium]|tara:strand:+ start:805 stop:1035 length:231 start_codon:yes stop_codon:yes gene_type:complete